LIISTNVGFQQCEYMAGVWHTFGQNDCSVYAEQYRLWFGAGKPGQTNAPQSFVYAIVSPELQSFQPVDFYFLVKRLKFRVAGHEFGLLFSGQCSGESIGET